MNVAPGATYEAVLDWGVTGLVGTLGIRILDNAGHTTTARSTAGIAEYPAGSGIYYVNKTAPGTRGQYTLLWDDGSTDPGHTASEELLVTSTSPNIVSSGSLYVTRDQIKATLSITGTSFDNDIDLAVEAASRAIDNVTGRRFYPATETRWFTPDRYDDYIRLGDVTAVDTVAVDVAGTGTYTETWVEGTDFYLGPPNAALLDEPYNRLILLSTAARMFPPFQRQVRVTGTFGWANVPVPVAQFAEILATKLMRRARDAPFGFVTHGAADAAAWIVRSDPDFNMLVAPYIRQPLLV